MEAQQTASMADGDQGRAGKDSRNSRYIRILQSLVHAELASSRNATRGRSTTGRHRQSLLLAKGQYPRPIIFLVQARDQMAKMASTQDRSG